MRAAQYAFIRSDAAALGPRFKFQKFGKCGAELAEAVMVMARWAADWQPPAGLEEFLAAGPTVCIGFGSMHSRRIARIVDTALETLARCGRQALILTGWSGYAPRCAGQDGNRED